MNKVHEYDGQFEDAAEAGAQGHAPGVAPGRRSLTQGMAPRSIVFRVESADAARELGAAFGPRDGRGVAAGAEHALDRAAASSGEGLRPDLRTRFEESLGVDLSGVRIHRSPESAAASSAVGARAYTVGDDIHFGAGQYAPDDPFGMHLIAHEVAHTVQQRGGAPVRQHKLEVSQAGDPLEDQADADADAMVAGRPKDLTSVELTALIQLRAEMTQAKTRLGTAGDAGAVSKAIADCDLGALNTATQKLSSAFTAVEDQVKRAKERLQTMPMSAHAHQQFQETNRAMEALDQALIAAATPVLSAYVIPGAPAGEGGNGAGGGGGDGALGAAVTARAQGLVPDLTRVIGLCAQASAASKAKGKQRTTAIEAVRAALLAMVPGLRAYVQKVMTARGVPADIVAGRPGASATPDLSAAGGDASADAEKGGGGSAPKFASSDATPFDTGATVELSKGGFGAEHSLKTKGEHDEDNVKGGASVDILNEQGELDFEGMKLEAGYTMGCGANVKIEGGFTQTINPPTFDGKQWVVSYSNESSSGMGGGYSADVIEKAKGGGDGVGGGVSVGVDGKVSGGITGGGSRVFPTPEAALAFYHAGDPGVTAIPALADTRTMQPGESRSLSATVGGEIGVKGTAGGASLGVTGSGGTTSDVKVTKKDGEKVQVTVRSGNNFGIGGSLSAGLGGVGIGLGGGAGSGSAESTTATFDLATAEGQAAYERWLAEPGAVPSGPGVTAVSTGEGESSSVNVNGSLLWANGQTNVTTGEFTETSADGKHALKTMTGSHTSSETDLALSKNARTDALEISQLDQEAASYTIKTAIQSGDAAKANAQLATILGEQQVHGHGSNVTAAMGGMDPSGKWSVERSYTKKDMDSFLKKIETEDVASLAAIDLKRKLKEGGASEAERHEILTAWFAKTGPAGGSVVQDTIGPGEISVSLAGNADIAGAGGKAIFDAKTRAMEDRLLDPKLSADDARALLRDVQGLYAEENGRGSRIADPNRYADLPDGLRHTLVQQVRGNQQALQALRLRVAAKVKDAGGGDVEGHAEVDSAMSAARTAEGRAITKRQQAHDRRRKHDGAHMAGHYSARDELHRSVVTNGAVANARTAYAHADGMWAVGSLTMTTAETLWEEGLRCDLLDEASRKRARACFDKAADSYGSAERAFIVCRIALDQVHEIARKEMPLYFGGYTSEFRGGLD